MRIRKLLVRRFVPVVAVLLAAAGSASAHSALCTCFDNGDGTVTCEGGFSDGSSASGVRMFIRQLDDKTLIRGRINADGEFTFEKPKGEYKVVFDGGPGHQVIVAGKEITE